MSCGLRVAIFVKGQRGLRGGCRGFAESCSQGSRSGMVALLKYDIGNWYRLGIYAASELMMKTKCFLLSFILLIFILGCTPENLEEVTDTSLIWYDEFLITTDLDSDGKPVNAITEIEYGVEQLICYMSIDGSNRFISPVRWYHEDRLISETVINFGENQQGAAYLLHTEPLPTGNYRCEWGTANAPTEILALEILPVVD